MQIEQLIENIRDPLYRTKFVNVPDIIADWLSDSGGLHKKDVLEFGCGEGTMALGVTLRKEAQRVVGVEILDVHEQCRALAQSELGVRDLPPNLFLCKITPGADLTEFGTFDVAYSWSVFEHVAQDMLPKAMTSVFNALKPGGHFFLQIDPLYYSPNGSHMMPWLVEPWAHLTMQADTFRRRLFEAPETPTKVRNEWAVYIPPNADTADERKTLWETYETLNHMTAPQLRRLAESTGFEVIRDYRTKAEREIPQNLLDAYDREALLTEQIVLLLRKPATA
ncbi:SAM-dependent methyltransferase [Paraburkholderia heleia]|uniref:SAM-dependent methyltransferase n=1 Tax=Paraburkholderia heleia TaxID=634127 RepID=UPI002AB62C3B|nr:class I SAM-dependent methyltransferase [Paraburkholderia heleia]